MKRSGEKSKPQMPFTRILRHQDDHWAAGNPDLELSKDVSSRRRAGSPVGRSRLESRPWVGWLREEPGHKLGSLSFNGLSDQKQAGSQGECERGAEAEAQRSRQRFSSLLAEPCHLSSNTPLPTSPALKGKCLCWSLSVLRSTDSSSLLSLTPTNYISRLLPKRGASRRLGGGR